MCNSWNHSYNCRCGFGGEGHLGINSGSAKLFESNFLTNRVSYESFINPNARCPVCKAPVFFYQSPYGGKVFFDELGHPWTKHPCTDSSLPSLFKDAEYLPKDKNLSSFIKSQNWENEGWKTFICYQMQIDYEIDRIRLIGYHGEHTKNIYHHAKWWGRRIEHYLCCEKEIPLITLSIKNINKWIQNNSCVFSIYPIMIKKSEISDNHFEISSFKLDYNGNLVTLYTNEAYMPKSANDVIFKGHIFQRKRVYEDSYEESEIFKNWKDFQS